MNIEPTDQKQPISDDQELAKVLAGISNDANSVNDEAAAQDAPAVPTPAVPMPTVDNAAQAPETPEVEAPAAPTPPPAPVAPSPVADGGLEAVKQQALGELRPLVDKLNVDADEKFDIYLLLLRSTDDKDLIAPAHEAAMAITDESKRAQALLDVIKEIDFLSQNK